MVKKYDWIWYNNLYVFCHYNTMYEGIYIKERAKDCVLYFFGEIHRVDSYEESQLKCIELFTQYSRRKERKQRLELLNKTSLWENLKTIFN